ncbi:uncharacterized protein F5891DRAFT_957420, partial [Suillus fuscotomentosus]
LYQCPVGHPDHATALTNLTCARFQYYIRDDLEEVDATISHFRDALALRPQPHPDHPFSLYNLARVLTWHHSKKGTVADIREAAQLYCELLPLCPDGSYLRSIVAGNDVICVIGGSSELSMDASDEAVHHRRVVLELCPLGHPFRSGALASLGRVVKARFDQHGSIDDLDTSIQLHREAASLTRKRRAKRDIYLNDLTCSLRAERDTYLNDLACSLVSRFDHQGKPNDLHEAISFHEEALRLHRAGHKSRAFSLDNLGGVLVKRFKECGNIDDITRAISLYRESLTLCSPGHPRRDTKLKNLALALKTRYRKSHIRQDLNEAIDLHRESLWLTPERHRLVRENLLHEIEVIPWNFWEFQGIPLK